MTQPASVTFDGTDRVLWVPTIADIDVPTLAELTDPSVLGMSCYFTDNGWLPDVTEADVPDDRLCSKQDYADAGRETHTLPLIYTTNPESPGDDEARLTLVNGATGFFVERAFLDVEDALAAGQFVSVWAVKLGRQKLIDRTKNTKWRISQMARLRPPGERFLVEIAA